LCPVKQQDLSITGETVQIYKESLERARTPFGWKLREEITAACISSRTVRRLSEMLSAAAGIPVGAFQKNRPIIIQFFFLVKGGKQFF